MIQKQYFKLNKTLKYKQYFSKKISLLWPILGHNTYVFD